MFFKKIKLDVHAQALSRAFDSMRSEYYSCIVANAKSAIASRFPTEKANLGGKADICLKGVQCLISMAFVRQMKYVPREDDANMLVGCLMHHSWSDDRDAVSHYVLEFKDIWNQTPELVAKIALEIVNYILGEDSDPWDSALLMSQTSRTLAPFPSAIRFSIAKEFKDRNTVENLQAEVEAISLAVSQQSLG